MNGFFHPSSAYLSNCCPLIILPSHKAWKRPSIHPGGFFLILKPCVLAKFCSCCFFLCEALLQLEPYFSIIQSHYKQLFHCSIQHSTFPVGWLCFGMVFVCSGVSKSCQLSTASMFGNDGWEKKENGDPKAIIFCFFSLMIAFASLYAFDIWIAFKVLFWVWVCPWQRGTWCCTQGGRTRRQSTTSCNCTLIW